MSWIPAVDICHRLSNISLKTKCWVLATQSPVIPIKISPYPGMSRLILEFNAKLLRERKRGICMEIVRYRQHGSDPTTFCFP